MQDRLLLIKDLRTHFFTYEGVVEAVDGVNLSLDKGEILGLVGETGCGKSVTALSILRLIQWPPGKIVSGQILFDGENLLDKTENEMRGIRGNKISMIFQEPMTSLNPVLKIGEQVVDVIRFHKTITKKEALCEAINILNEVGMPDPENSVKRYPHELSGGLRQRVMIAMAISCSPELLIADEPTTFLDVTIQAQVLRLMKELKEKINASMLLVTHNLGIVAQNCGSVVVMYAGNVVERGDVRELFHNPAHPYTKKLMALIPRVDQDKERLEAIKGTIPRLIDPPTGCRFHPRCPNATQICSSKKPGEVRICNTHSVSCFLYS